MNETQILVVEDDHATVRLIETELYDLGYRAPIVATTGEAAVEKAVEMQPDLILMDIKLGNGMDGVEAAGQIRTQFDIPVIYLTAYLNEELLDRAKNTEPFGYILKPFQTNDLLTTIEMALYKHQLAQQLKMSEARYRAVSELTADFAYALRVEPDGTLITEWATEALTDITGFTLDEFVSRGGMAKIVYPDDADITRRQMERLLTGQVPDPQEFRIVTKKGETRWIRFCSRPVWDQAENRVIRIYGAVQDINEYKRMEEALKRSEWEKAAILNSMTDLVGYLDTEMKVMWANKAAGESVGLAPMQLVGRHCYELWHQRSQPCVDCPVVRVLQTGQPQQGEMTTPDGRLWFLKGYPVKDENGNIIRVVEVGSDITKQKQAEVALRQSNSRLKKALTELKDTQQQVLQQERLAAVGQLAAGMAHDFNNLLTSIIGFTELMLMSLDMPEATRQHHLDRILKQAQRGAHLVHQILDFSRTSICQPRPFNLVPFLKESIQLLRRTIPENICIDLEINLTTCPINADITQIQQVITNLAVNARDAMPAGGELKLGLTRFTLAPDAPPPCSNMPSGEWVVLSVSDIGQGIPPDNLPHIFEPFFTTKTVGEGTGLGLAQVYGIIKQHRGYIEVSSQEGQGTKFVIYLPALMADWETTSAHPTSEIALGHGETILLVEDEAEVVKVGQAMLESLGYQVLTATNGQEALKLYPARREEIDLVLTDMVMPEIDGVTLFQTLKLQFPDVRVVVMTGYPLVGGEAENLLSQGINGWLQKPLNLSQLSQVISQVVQAKPPS